MDTYNAAAWLLDRHIEAGSADTVAVRYRGQDVSYGAMQRLVWRVQRGLAAIGGPEGETLDMLNILPPSAPGTGTR